MLILILNKLVPHSVIDRQSTRFQCQCPLCIQATENSGCEKNKRPYSMHEIVAWLCYNTCVSRRSTVTTAQLMEALWLKGCWKTLWTPARHRNDATINYPNYVSSTYPSAAGRVVFICWPLNSKWKSQNPLRSLPALLNSALQTPTGDLTGAPQAKRVWDKLRFFLYWRNYESGL